MKKLSKLLLALVICFTAGMILVGCKQAKIESIMVKEGSLSSLVLKGNSYDYSKLELVVEYEDETSKTVKYSENRDDFVITPATLDTTTAGIKTVSITYKEEHDTSFNVEVVETTDELLTVVELKSQLLEDFEDNRAVQSNSQIEYMDRTQQLYVGDDNAFDFRITAKGIDEEGNTSTITTFKNNVIVQLKEGTSFTVLEGSALTNMVTVNDDASLKFNQNAIGNTFRVTVEAVNIDPERDENATRFTTELTVIDGYNVYNIADLALYDNTNDAWNDIKASLPVQSVNALILQNNITLSKEFIPEEYFWTTATTGYDVAQAKTDVTLDGTLIDSDSTAIFKREITSGQTFNFIGNYFNISADNTLRAVVENDGQSSSLKGVQLDGVDSGDGVTDASGMTAHIPLFYTYTNDVTEETQVNWKNLGFTGNAPLSADPKASGGLLLMKNQNVNFNAYNTINHNFYIGYFMLKGEAENQFDGSYVIDKCKGYNSYQCLLYAWGAENFVVKNSEFLSSGGPAIILDHANPNSDGSGGYPCHLDIIASTIESKVTGKEPWFATYNGAGAIVGQLALTDAFYNGLSGLPNTGKTIIAGYADESGLQVAQINVKVLMKSGSAEGVTTSPIRGSVNFFNSELDYEKHYGLNGQTQQTTTYGLNMDSANGCKSKALSSGNHYLESNASGGYINSGFDAQTNLDASIVGTIKAVGIKTILTQINSAFNDVENFNSLTLAQKKENLIANITMLGAVSEEGLIALYSNGVNNNLISEIENFETLEATEKQAKLIEQINNLADVSYAEGDSINVYLSLGMGAIIGLYDQQTAE